MEIYSSKVPHVHLLLLLKQNFKFHFKYATFIIWEQGGAYVFLGLYIPDLDRSAKFRLLLPTKDFSNQQFLFKKFIILEIK